VPPPTKDKLKLTEPGADALRAWMRSRGWTLERLASESGMPHAMACSRALRRQGALTLEQIGRVVALAGGELTAAQLVGLDLAAAIPSLPLVAQRASASAAPPRPSEPVDDEDPDPGTALKDRGDRHLEAAYPGAALTLARAASGEGTPPTPSQIRSALAVVEIVGGKARQREESQREVAHAPEDQLMARLRLVYSQLTGKSVAALEAEERGDFSGEGIA
jgi:hypothetical protein